MSGGRLEGKRVLVTRPRERSEELCFLLEDEGAEVISLPLLELLPPEDPRPIRYAAEHVDRFQWIAFASPSAVDAFVEALREAGTFAALSRVKIAVVGPRTAAAARAHRLEISVEADNATGTGLFDVLKQRISDGDDVLLPAAENGRPELSEALREHGAQVTKVVAYRSERTEISPGRLAELKTQPPDIVVLASPRTAEAFVEQLGPLPARLVAIGPTTAKAIESLGLRVSAIASKPTPEGLLEAATAAVLV